MNRLVADSPYLLQHADNPVEWLPWGDEAFSKARLENKPIFLSIGYSTCHWCHVMAHESFENVDVAAVLNASFVPIKVDREERPDVDRVYMTFVHATTGSGGWPMSVWLTPDLKPFYGGTYFPPSARWERPGFVDILGEIARVWKAERARSVRCLRNHSRRGGRCVVRKARPNRTWRDSTSFGGWCSGEHAAGARRTRRRKLLHYFRRSLMKRTASESRRYRALRQKPRAGMLRFSTIQLTRVAPTRSNCCSMRCTRSRATPRRRYAGATVSLAMLARHPSQPPITEPTILESLHATRNSCRSCLSLRRRATMSSVTLGAAPAVRHSSRTAGRSAGLQRRIWICPRALDRMQTSEASHDTASDTGGQMGDAATSLVPIAADERLNDGIWAYVEQRARDWAKARVSQKEPLPRRCRDTNVMLRNYRFLAGLWVSIAALE